MYNCSVNFLDIFPHGFSDPVDFPISCLYTLLQIITFGTDIPDKIVTITRGRVHFKYVIQAKPFSGFDVVGIHNQTAFRVS